MDDVSGLVRLPALALLGDLARTWFGAELGAGGVSACATCGVDLTRLPAEAGYLVHRCRTGTGDVGDGPALAAASLPGLGYLWASCPGEITDAELRRAGQLVAYGARLAGLFGASVAATPLPAAGSAPLRTSYGEIIGGAAAMQEVYRLLDKVVLSESTVLIGGESGTGKELVARAIHYGGSRRDKAFIVQNCSAFNDNLLESALFGHARGAFTGAVQNKKGLFEVADEGTFFLDEIGDMSGALQVKLLRVLQEGTFTPVGSNEARKVDVRVIAATHKDLAREVREGRFREDLYYRINVIRVHLPPLRDRPEDMPTLVRHFLAKHARGTRVPRLSDGAMRAFLAYAWPGNVREMENEIERLTVLGGDDEELSQDLLSPRIRDAIARQAAALPASPPPGAPVFAAGVPLKDALETVERNIIAKGLERTQGNTAQLARDLGVSRSTLLRRCEYYGLGRKE